MKLLLKLTLAGLIVCLSSWAHAFCGFYVAKADTKLFNQASQVVLTRHENRTVITMANDYQGDPQEFAMVIPVPTVLKRQQINVADQSLLDHLDAYSSPRLVEYFDSNPCQPVSTDFSLAPSAPREYAKMKNKSETEDRYKSLGVKIEAKYAIGEYDILILSAKESQGLEIWLRENGYKIPDGAAKILGSYLKQDMKFFVAKVNLENQNKLGFKNLRPLQVAFESNKFMLPIRLGTVNAKGPQELFIYTLTKKGRVETTNYRTVKLPTNTHIPPYIKDEFDDFYRAMFNRQVEKEKMRTVFLEYAWDMGWCDPCAADPLSSDQLRKLGVFWLRDQETKIKRRGRARPQNVYITRLHLRYDAEHFPEDLVFQETSNRQNFQGRYILQQPWTGAMECPAAKQYRQNVQKRQEKEAQNLASLTGWKLQKIRSKIGPKFSQKFDDSESWYEWIWKE